MPAPVEVPKTFREIRPRDNVAVTHTPGTPEGEQLSTYRAGRISEWAISAETCEV